MNKRLIVNADDLGLSEQVNRGIFDAHHNGIVTSATLMVTMPGVEHALANLAGSRLDVGLHIDLSWGRPVSPPAEIPSLVDESGRFIGKKRLMSGLFLRKIRPQDVAREISAQASRFRQTGLALFHVDVHQHFHGFPVVMQALAGVASRERIPFIRLVNESVWTKPVYAMIYLMFRLAKHHFPGSARAADHFLGLALTDRLNETTLLPQLRTIKPGLTELMCHPGYHDPLLTGVSRLQSREAEVRALTSRKVQDYLTEHGIVLTTFRDEYQAGNRTL